MYAGRARAREFIKRREVSMKTFSGIEQFQKRISTAPAWDDYFTLGGKMFKLYEYGPGIGVNVRPDYVYFVNKRTHDAIKVEYDCPSYEWKKTGRTIKSKKLQEQAKSTGHYSYDENGTERVYHQTRRYQLFGVEFIPSMDLWRTDTL